MKQCTEALEAHAFVYSMHKSPIDLVRNLLRNVGINAIELNECPDTCIWYMCVSFSNPALRMNICEWFRIFGHKILDYGLRWLEMKKSESILTFDIRRKNQIKHFQSFICCSPWTFQCTVWISASILVYRRWYECKSRWNPNHRYHMLTNLNNRGIMKIPNSTKPFYIGLKVNELIYIKFNLFESNYRKKLSAWQKSRKIE